MADQRKTETGELTPDQCIDFAAGLLDGEEKADVLRRASASPESEELLRSVMAQAESARSAAATAADQRQPVREPLGSSLTHGFRQFLESLFGAGRLVPAMAGASLLILGLILGAGSMQLLQTDGAGAGAPARLISLFPSATRTAGPAAAVSAGTGLYIELNGIDYPCQTPLFFDVTGPSGQTLFQGRLHCQPETGEWAGLFLPDQLLARTGDYRLHLNPDTEAASPGDGPLEFRFSIR